MGLVFNTFAPLLFELARSCDPGDNSHVRDLILRGVCKFDTSVTQNCRELAATVEELWSLGVFHWEDCRAIVLGSAIAVPVSVGMGKKGKKTKKTKKGAKGGQKSRKHRQRKDRRARGDNQKAVRAQQSLAPSTATAQGFHETPSDDNIQTPVHSGRCFNPSTVNAHDEGDTDETMVDLSPAGAAIGDTQSLSDEDTIIACMGVDIFRAASSRDARDGSPAPSSPGADTHDLQDAYASNLDTKLSNLDEHSLGLAGEAVKQVVLEATYEFLHKCIPVSDQQKTWSHILNCAKLKHPGGTCIVVPDGTLDLKNGRRPMDHLISNCIEIVSQDFKVVDQKDLKLAFDRGMTLCDALDDVKRKEALEVALHSLNWLMLGLDCKALEVYRHANLELDRINASYSSDAWPVAFDAEGISNARNVEERNLLWSMKRSFEKFKEPFRVNFLESLQRLLGTDL